MITNQSTWSSWRSGVLQQPRHRLRHRHLLLLRHLVLLHYLLHPHDGLVGLVLLALHLRVHLAEKKIWTNEISRLKKEITWFGTHWDAADLNLSLAPTVLTPRSARTWSGREGIWRTSISSSTNCWLTWPKPLSVRNLDVSSKAAWQLTTRMTKSRDIICDDT